jgi:pimeloyl-ACP methyl ester carboxylesterase
MPEVISHGVRLDYEVVGDGRPLMLLHGFSADRSWWVEPGYVTDLRRDHRLLLVDLPGHGASDHPHESAAYSSDSLVGNLFAVADAEDVDRFAIWGQSYGGYLGWMAGAAAPERVLALVTSGAWDPRPFESPPETDEWAEALRRGGTRALVDQFKTDMGETFDSEFPAWALDVTLRADPEALIALRRARFSASWAISEDELRAFPVPALLIAGEFDDEDDAAARIAAMIPDGRSLRLPGLGHPGSCAASTLTVPTVRAFLERYFG